jgi:hypothetical protein
MRNKTISEFEAKLESVLKGIFQEEIKNKGAIEIAADFHTHATIDEIVGGLGLSVYGMSITPSQFTITLEFDDTYLSLAVNTRQPRYLKIHFENSGDYEITIDQATTNENWYCGITDHFFNVNLSAAEVDAVIHSYDVNLTHKILSRAS